jgi:hypothetical protein
VMAVDALVLEDRPDVGRVADLAAVSAVAAVVASIVASIVAVIAGIVTIAAVAGVVTIGPVAGIVTITAATAAASSQPGGAQKRAPDGERARAGPAGAAFTRVEFCEAGSHRLTSLGRRF